MKTVTYNIPNISCNHCVHTINLEISELAGVKSVQADKDNRTAIITFDPPATEELIVEALKAINYAPLI